MSMKPGSTKPVRQSRMRLSLFVFAMAIMAYAAYCFYIYNDARRNPVTPAADTTGTGLSMRMGQAEAENLLFAVRNAYEQGHYLAAREYARELQDRFPNTAEAQEAARLIYLSSSEPDMQRTARRPVSPPPQRTRRTTSTPDPAPATTPARSVPEPATEPVATVSEPAATLPEPPTGDVRIIERVRENERRLEAAMGRMREVRDDRAGVTRYYNRNVSHYVYKNSFEIYIEKPDGGDPSLRLRIYYHGDEWLTLRGYEVYADDREYRISADYGNLERGRGRGGAWEFYDTAVTGDEMRAIQAVKDANRNALRYLGTDRVVERALTEDEKLRLEDVLRAFEALNLQSEYLSRNLTP